MSSSIQYKPVNGDHNDDQETQSQNELPDERHEIMESTRLGYVLALDFCLHEILLVDRLSFQALRVITINFRARYDSTTCARQS